MELTDLDEYLEYLVANKAQFKQGFPHKTFTLEVPERLKLKPLESHAVIDKFIGEGFLEKNPMNHNYFLLTFEGEFFSKQGGYVAQRARDDDQAALIQRQTDIAEENRKISSRMGWATILIAIGTLITAAYYVYLFGKDMGWWHYYCK